MNSKIIAAVIAVVVIVGGVYAVTQNNKNTEVASNTESENRAEGATAETASIKSLMQKGGSQQCTFSTVADGSKSDGTIYLAGGKMRGDFDVITENVTVMSHTIFDGTTSYIWTHDAGEGLKMNVDPADIESYADNQPISADKNLEFECKSWNEDSSKFVPPSDVKFNDLPAMPSGNALPNNADTKAMQQAICNNLPEPSKSECLAAVK